MGKANSKMGVGRFVLDEVRRRQIISLLSLGCSRRMASRFVGCAPSTITRAAARDPEFARQIAQAEQALEVSALRTLSRAAKKDKYWRAAAWIAERRNPEDFAPRRPAQFTPRDVVQIIGRVLDVFQEQLTSEMCHRVRLHLAALLGEYEVADMPILVAEIADRINPTADRG